MTPKETDIVLMENDVLTIYLKKFTRGHVWDTVARTGEVITHNNFGKDAVCCCVCGRWFDAPTSVPISTSGEILLNTKDNIDECVGYYLDPFAVGGT